MSKAHKARARLWLNCRPLHTSNGVTLQADKLAQLDELRTRFAPKSEMKHFRDLLVLVTDQTTRRVIDGEEVPSSKIR